MHVDLVRDSSPLFFFFRSTPRPKTALGNCRPLLLAVHQPAISSRQLRIIAAFAARTRHPGDCSHPELSERQSSFEWFAICLTFISWFQATHAYILDVFGCPPPPQHTHALPSVVFRQKIEDSSHLLSFSARGAEQEHGLGAVLLALCGAPRAPGLGALSHGEMTIYGVLCLCWYC